MKTRAINPSIRTINSTINSGINRITVFLVACSISLMMQPFPVSAGSNNNAPGTVTTWGDGISTPVPVAFPAGVVPVSISAYEPKGGLAITQDGSLYEWFGVRSVGGTKVIFPPPVTHVKAVSLRFSHALAMTDSGLYAWGGNSKGQLGDGTTVDRAMPGQVVFPPTVMMVSAIAAGYSHSLAVTDDGLYAWGDNFNGELGDGTRLNRSLPVKVLLPVSVHAVFQIAAGRNTSYALTDDGLYAWGNDFAGQLGNGSFGIMPDGSSDAGQTLPVKVLFPSKGKVTVTAITDIAAGEYYALAITSDGLYAWGMNVSGCLGTGTGTTALPAKVKFPKAVTTVRAIAATTNHSLAVTDDGLYAWGNNSQGQLGINNSSDKLTPTKVPGENNAVDVAAAEYSSLAIH
jgi:alpha-tubulin suppressor-like RCC1 family protein